MPFDDGVRAYLYGSATGVWAVDWITIWDVMLFNTLVVTGVFEKFRRWLLARGLFDLLILKACSLTDVQGPFKSFLTRNELVASAWRDFCRLDCARKRRNQICAEHRPEAKGSRSADPVRFCLGCRARRLGSEAQPDGLVRKRWNTQVR